MFFHYSNFIIIGVIQLLASICPGPDFVMVIKNSFVGARAKSIATVIGISSALAIHVIYINVGLAEIIIHSHTLFVITKCIGAGYLIYIGIKAFVIKLQLNYSEEKTNISVLKGFREGFLCNLFNPKAIFFLIGLFTLVIKPDTLKIIRLFYEVEVVLITLCWFLILSVIINIKLVKLKLLNIQTVFLKIMGILLIIFGTKLFFIHL